MMIGESGPIRLCEIGIDESVTIPCSVDQPQHRQPGSTAQTRTSPLRPPARIFFSPRSTTRLLPILLSPHYPTPWRERRRRPVTSPTRRRPATTTPPHTTTRAACPRHHLTMLSRQELLAGLVYQWSLRALRRCPPPVSTKRLRAARPSRRRLQDAMAVSAAVRPPQQGRPGAPASPALRAPAVIWGTDPKSCGISRCLAVMRDWDFISWSGRLAALAVLVPLVPLGPLDLPVLWWQADNAASRKRLYLAVEVVTPDPGVHPAAAV